MTQEIIRKRACPEPRRRGGQPGNQNARKHGYYSRIFNKAERADYYSAGDVQGIDEEIALIRHVIKTVASFKDDRHILVLVRAANVLNRLVRTRQKIRYSRYDEFRTTISDLVRDVLIPMGVNIGSLTPSHSPSNRNETDNGRNEAVLP